MTYKILNYLIFITPENNFTKENQKKANSNIAKENIS